MSQNRGSGRGRTPQRASGPAEGRSAPLSGSASLGELVPAHVDAVIGGASPERISELEAKIAAALARTKAPATVRAYRSDWADFVTWCATSGFDALPATAGTVAAYVAELAQPPDDRAPLKSSTITRRLSAISEAHRLAGFESPTSDRLVRDTMAGIRRMLGVARTQKRGISTDDLRAAVAELGGRPIEVRDRVVLLVGFAGGFRRSELVSIDLEDLEERPEGLLIRLGVTKTDQEGAGRSVEIVYGDSPATCPVRAIRTWAALLGTGSGPLLRPVDRHGNIADRRLSAQAVAGIVKRHMSRLGYPVSDFAGHSLRRGMATTAARNGAAERTIMATTGHTSTDTLRGYVEEAEQFTDPASGYLGL